MTACKQLFIRKYYFLFLSVMMLLLIGCSDDFTGEPSGRGCKLSVDASILAHQTGSRSLIFGNEFPAGSTIGLLIGKHSDNSQSFEPYGAYNNISMQKDEDQWNFYFNGTGTPSPDLFVMSDKDLNNMDVYAYSPWSQGCTSPDRVSFSVNLQTYYNMDDFLYAVENSSDANKNISTSDGTAHTVKLHFRHFFALIRIGIKNRYSVVGETGKSEFVNGVGLQLMNPNAKTKLYSRGYYNALTGSVCEGTMVEQMDHFLSSMVPFDASKYSYIDIPVPPTEVEDDALQIYLTINNVKHPTAYTIKASDVLHTDGTKGLKSGFVYTFYFTYDNYVRLDNVQIQDTWTDESKEYIF